MSAQSGLVGKCINPRWPLRKQLLTGFMACAMSLLIVQYVFQSVTIAVVGSMTEDRSVQGLDDQLQRHLTSSANETGKAVAKQFEAIETTVLQPITVALQQVTRQPAAAYTLGKAHVNDIRCRDASATKDRTRSCLYFAKGRTVEDVTHTDDVAQKAQSALLDRWLPNLPNENGQIAYMYIGMPSKDPSAAGSGLFRIIPSSKLSDVPNTLYACHNPEGTGQRVGVPTHDCYNPVVRPWYKKAMDAVRDHGVVRGLGPTVVTDPYRGAEGAERPWMITIAKAVYAWNGANDQEVYSANDVKGLTQIGVVGVDVLLATVQSLVASVQILQTGFISLVGASGAVIADKHLKYNDPNSFSTTQVYELRASDGIPCDSSSSADQNGCLFRGAYDDINQWKGDVSKLEADSSHKLVKYYSRALAASEGAGTTEFALAVVRIVPVCPSMVYCATLNSWVVLASVPTSEAHGTIDGLKSAVKSAVSETLGVTAGITIGTMLLVTAIIVTQASHITRPIQIMTNAAQSIVNNADSEDVFEHVQSDQLRGDNDEIGDLVQEFKAMVSGLSKKDEAAAATALQDHVAWQENPFAQQGAM